MRLLAFGSHVTSRNRGSFQKQERKPWERGYSCETCRSDLSSILKIILCYCFYTIRSCRPVPLWLRKPFSPKSYSLDSITCKSKILIEGYSYCLHVSSKLFFIQCTRILLLILILIACLCGKCAIIYMLCRSPNMTIWRYKNVFTLIMYALCQMDTVSR